MTFKHKIIDRVSKYKYNNDSKDTCDDLADDIINLFDTALTDLVVEERVNRRSICTRTIRKIREQVLYLKKTKEEDDDGSEKISPEPPN